MVNSLRKLDFSNPTGHYTWKKIRAPLEKILGAPLLYPIPPGPALPHTALPHLSGSADHLRSFPAPSGNDRPFMTHPGPVRRGPALLGTSRPCLDLSYAVRSGPALPIPARLCSTLSRLVRSCPACMNYFSCHYVCSMHCANPNCTVLGSRATMVK